MRRLFRNAVLGAAKFISNSIFPNSDRARSMFHRVRNWYTAGFPLLTGNTSYLPSIVQDARFDQNYITRREMLRRMRFWAQNSAIVESILSVGERYTVGPAGLTVAFYPVDDAGPENDGAGDDPWYENAEVVVAEGFQNIGWNGESMAELLKIGYRCQKVDGDAFLLKTRKRGPLIVGKHNLQVSKPCLQLIEGHRVETPFDKWTNEGVTTIDGCQFEMVSVDGRPMLQKTGYWMRSGSGEFETNSSWQFITLDNAVHLRNLHRANQPRSVSDFYPVEQDIHKLEDMLEMEMKAQNSQSSRAVKITNAAGQHNSLDRKLEAISRARGIAPDPTADEQEKALHRTVDFYRRAYGGEVYAVKQGEEVDFQAPNRPSEATLNLFELLVNRICAGMKAPRCLVMQKISGQSSKSQGTEVRAELDSADGYYESDFQKWATCVREAAIYYLEWAINNDPRVADAPDNWRSCIQVQQPKACNVDVEYNAQAATMELASGQTNYHLLYAPRGLSARRELRKLSREQKFIEKLGLKLTLPALLPGQIELDGVTAQPQETQKAEQ